MASYTHSHPSRPRIEVHGHRGARAQRPENTLPAFAYALSIGVDVLEMDMNVTRDNVIVITHDPDLNPAICLDENGHSIHRGIFIRNLTLAQVKSYDCGSLRHPDFPQQRPVPGTRIPTLDEVFDLVQNAPGPAARRVRFNIETKIDPRFPEQAPSPQAFAELFLNTVKKHNLLPRVILQSFDWRTLTEAQKIEPKITISALTEKESTGTNYAKIIAEIKPEVLSPYLNEIAKADVLSAHQADVKVVPWTANTPAQWERLVNFEVDGIISDDPKALIDYLKEKNLR